MGGPDGQIDIDALVAAAGAVEGRLYRRLGTKSARGLDVDACVVIAKMSDALELQQAVVEAAQRFSKTHRESDWASLDKTLADLDAPPEGDGTKEDEDG